MSARDAVYYGIWINHAVGGVYASTLTLSSRNGAYLIAVLALFIRIVGSAMWSIMRLFLFRYYWTRVPTGGLDHQRQAILRNTTTEVSAILMLYNLWSSRRGRSHRGVHRSLCIIAMGALNLSFFAIAGILASRVKYSTTEALVRANLSDCGTTQSFSNLQKAVSAKDYFDYYSADRKIDLHASSLSPGCYNGTVALNASTCDVPGRQIIPWTMSSSTCQFDRTICGNATAVRFDSGLIDSLKHLGINSSPSDRLLTRIETTCQPLNVSSRLVFLDNIEGKRVNSTPFTGSSPADMAWGRSVALYLGNSTVSSREETYVIKIPERGTSSGEATERGYLAATFPIGLRIDVEVASFLNRHPINGSASFIPIPELWLQEGRLRLLILANSDLYEEAIDDPWFAATEHLRGSDQKLYYYSRQVLQVVACSTIRSICDYPTYTTTEMHCESAPEFAPVEYFPATLRPNGDSSSEIVQESIRDRILYALAGSDLSITLQKQNAAALSASKYSVSGVSLASKNDFSGQWIKELQVLLANGLLNFQTMSAGYVSDPHNLFPNKALASSRDNWMCSHQIVISKTSASFSVVGIALIIGIGVIVLILAFCGEKIAWACGGKHPLPWFFMSEWNALSFLQLQRLAYEARGLGVWSGEGEIPVELDGPTFTVPKRKECKLPEHHMTGAKFTFDPKQYLQDTPEHMAMISIQQRSPNELNNSCTESGRTTDDTSYDDLDIEAVGDLAGASNVFDTSVDVVYHRLHCWETTRI